MSDSLAEEHWHPLTRVEMAKRAARDIPEGWYVNLGIGIPTLISSHIPSDREVIMHSENGVLGFGSMATENERDPWLVNAGKQHVSLLEGAAYFDHAESFLMISGGHLDLCVLGAFQVSQDGSIANWATSVDDGAPAVGGAMDLAVGAKQLWVLMEHTTREGAPRLVEELSYPVTAHTAVSTIYTNLGVFDVVAEGLMVRETVSGLSIDELRAVTQAKLIIGE